MKHNTLSQGLKQTEQTEEPIMPALSCPQNQAASAAASVSRETIQVQVLELCHLTAADRQAWQELEADAVCPNPFLSPDFVMPAWRHLESHTHPLLIVITRGLEWIGLGIFESSRPRRRMPVPHLRCWRSEHSFLQGLLLRQGETQAALQVFWQFMLHGQHNWHAISFAQLPHDSPYYPLLHETGREQGADVYTGESFSRACLWLKQETPETVLEGISPRRQRSLRQAWNWLNRQGETEFRIQQNTRQLGHSCRRFLELEALGWKGNQYSALSCTPANESFFREMSNNFILNQRLFVSELTCNDEVIGSVVHLLAGDAAYAFKLGWEPQLARGCPGFQLKAQMLYRAHSRFPQLQLIDSCSSPGSFIEHVWSGRRQFSDSVFFTSRAGVIAGSFLEALRWLRGRSRAFLPHPATDSPAETED